MLTMIRYELRQARRRGGWLTAILYLAIALFGFYTYINTHDSLRSLPQMIAYMYNGRCFVALSIVMGLHVAAFMHDDQGGYTQMIMTSLAPERSGNLMSRFMALTFRLLLFQLLAVAIAIGCTFYLHLPIALDEIGYGIMAFVEIYVIYLFVIALFTLLAVVFKDELFNDLLNIVFSFLPVFLFILLNRFRIDLTGFSVTATIYELGNDVNVNQGLIASCLAFLYCCACMLISSIILRKRDL